jgi:uncharacterized phage-associated protein
MLLFILCSVAEAIMTSPYDARVIANFLLDHAAQRGLSLTQLSLLKLIYFAHGWYLSRFGVPLVENQFEAWEKGPVVRVVRDAFKEFGDRPITKRAERTNIYTGEVDTVRPALSNEDADFVCSVFDRYHVYSAGQLSEMTHERGSPWDRLWNSEEVIVRVGLRIKNEEIKSHFDAIARRKMLS